MFIRRKNLFFRYLTFFSFLICFFFLTDVPSVLAIGLTPSSVQFNQILHNTSQSRLFTVTRSNGEVGDLNIRFSPIEENMAQKFVVTPESRFVMKADEKSRDFFVEVNPGNIANGSYRRIVSFVKETIADDEGGRGMSVQQGVIGNLLINVGGAENLAYKIIDMYADETEVGQDVTLHINVNNTGNVDWHAKKMTVSFKKTDGTGEVRQDVPYESIPVFLAGHSEVKNLVIPAKLEKGEYIFTASFFDTDASTRTLARNGDQKFQVYPEGTFAQSVEFLSFTSNKTVYAKGEKIRLDGEFENTGSVSVHATPVVTVMKGDETIDLVREKEISAAKGSKTPFTFLLSYPDSGDYKLSAYIDLGSKRSETKSLEVKISDMASAGGAALSFLNNPFGLAIAVVVALLIFFLVKRRQKKNTAEEKHVTHHKPVSKRKAVIHKKKK